MNQLNDVKHIILRCRSRFTITVLALVALAASAAAQQFTIGSYHLQKSTRVSLTQYDYTYTADLMNSGNAATNVVGTVTSNSPTTIVTKGTVTFGAIAAGATITSVDTFTIRQDRTVAFDPTSLVWTFAGPQKPMAIALYSQTVQVGQSVELDGTHSTDQNGTPLTYQWTLISAPPGDPAAINNPTLPVSTLLIDQQGTYVVQLVVNDGTSNSDPAIVTLSMTSTPPTANAGQNQLASVGTAVQLDGSHSIDPDGNPITYAWSILSAPSGSAASISDTTLPLPSFTPDLPGTYVAQLIVTDTNASSTPSTVTISTTHIPPTAKTGYLLLERDAVGMTFDRLDGSLSTDANGLPLTYSWALISKPEGSNATLSDATAMQPTFFMDLSGIYVVQLVVKDALDTSLPATVGIFTGLPPPLANAGPNQSVSLNPGLVNLDGTHSGAFGATPTFSWSILYQPKIPGVVSILDFPNTPTPFFPIYGKGTYVAQLIVGDGIFRSLPSTVAIDVFASFRGSSTFTGNNSEQGLSASPDSPPTAGEVETITSTDPTHFSFSANPNVVGVPTLTIPMTPAPFIFVQGQNFSGTTPITATYTISAPGFTSATNTLTLGPTGWYFYTPAYTTYLSAAPRFLGAELSNLDAATLAVGYVGKSTGFGPQAGVVSIAVTNSNPAVGTLTGSAVSGSLQFTPLAVGTTVVTMTEPPGFSTPSDRSLQTTITVTNPLIQAFADYSYMANNAMITGEVSLAAPAPTDEIITVSSSDPTQFLLSTSPTTVGSGSIAIPLAAGTQSVPKFYIQGQNYSDTAYNTGYLTASAPNYLSILSPQLGLSPSALVIVGSGTLSLPVTSQAPLSVALAPLGLKLNRLLNYQPLGPQAPPTPVVISSSSPAVATIDGNPSIITVGNSMNTAPITVIPNTTGTTTLTVIQPPGYSTPSDGSDQLVITVTP